MSGHLRGVATRLKTEEPAALHVHCLAYCLNLCLQDAARTSVTVQDILQLAMELVKLIEFSPKRSSLFKAINSQMATEAGGLRPLCPTRWTVGSGAMAAVMDNYAALLTTLEEVHDMGCNEYVEANATFCCTLWLETLPAVVQSNRGTVANTAGKRYFYSGGHLKGMYHSSVFVQPADRCCF